MKREETLFARALALPPPDRGAFLARACDGDERLRQRVDALLSGYESEGAALDQLPVPEISDLARIDDSVARKECAPGTRIGRYKLLQQLGEGGCGVVFMAEQERPLRRRVALKVVKLGMDTREVIARFEAERQALALMDHPNIAQVLDAGSTDRGRPYFVMELVRGTPITRHCDDHQLGTEDRLRLFIQVCSAVQHAHQKGILHRDLKPSNILVTLHDGVPVPKVIDFGIAKAMHGRLTDRTLFTAFEQFVGTPAYMSPEQMEMSGLDVDTRTDIYSLGVLLYELLTGRPPFGSKDLLRIGLDEMRRTIREREPPKPSTCVSTLNAADGATVARQRGLDLPKLRSWLRGDIDWIVMRCLEKDRARRYETASSLASDLRRHLDHLPVTARPPRTSYVIAKYARRHRQAVAAAALIVVALITGLLLAIAGYQRAVTAQHEAERERASALAAQRSAEQARSQAEDVISYLLQDLTPALQQYGRLPLVAGVATKAEAYLAGVPDDHQDASSQRARAAALETIAGVHRSSGDHPAAKSTLDAAIAFRRALAPSDPESAAQMLVNEWIAANYEAPRSAKEWETYKRAQLEKLRNLYRRHPRSKGARRSLAWALTDFSRASAFYYNQEEDAVITGTDACALWEELIEHYPEDETLHADYIGSLEGLASALYATGATPASIEVGERAMAHAAAALRRDPWNQRLRSAAAATARQFSARTFMSAPQRARDAERVAREHFHVLLEVDPANAEWRTGYAWAHAVEPHYEWFDGQTEAARAGWRRFESLLAPHATPALATVRGTLVRVSLLLARAAARVGDRTDCETQLRHAKERFESYYATLPQATIHQYQSRALWLHGRCLVALEWHDWPELERLASELIEESSRGLRLQDDESELLLRRACAQSLRGLARLRRDEIDLALSDLREAGEGFRSAPRALLRFAEPREALAADAAEWLAAALVVRGQRQEARGVLEPALATREEYLARDPGLWRWKQEFARTVALLVPLRGAETERSQALLDRAEAFLRAPENQSRLTVEDQACKDRLARLRNGE